MIVNRLTEALGKTEFDEFLNQINLPDITHVVGESDKEVQIDDYTTILGEDWWKRGATEGYFYEDIALSSFPRCRWELDLMGTINTP